MSRILGHGTPSPTSPTICPSPAVSAPSRSQTKRRWADTHRSGPRPGKAAGLPTYSQKMIINSRRAEHALIAYLFHCLRTGAPARLGPGALAVALSSAAHAGRVALFWPARSGRRPRAGENLFDLTFIVAQDRTQMARSQWLTEFSDPTRSNTQVSAQSPIIERHRIKGAQQSDVEDRDAAEECCETGAL